MQPTYARESLGMTCGGCDRPRERQTSSRRRQTYALNRNFHTHNAAERDGEKCAPRLACEVDLLCQDQGDDIQRSHCARRRPSAFL
jgi:hypothetical protein